MTFKDLHIIEPILRAVGEEGYKPNPDSRTINSNTP